MPITPDAAALFPAAGSMPGAAAESPAGGGWRDGWYWSADGIRLHWRERPGPAHRPTLLCLAGLTRNAGDFAALGDRLAGRWRVVAVDLRGRGESAWPKDSLTYVAMTYLQDLDRLIAEAGISRFVAIGSSVGGILALQMVTRHRAAMAGVVLNDIGPEVEAAGMARLRGNVGRSSNWPTWVHAARDFAARNHEIHPDWQLADWLAFAKRVCKLSSTGRIVWDYDPRIADPFRLPHHDHGIDLWAAFAMLHGLPVLSLRGALSDVFGAATQARMQAVLPEVTMVEVPGVGHAPTLSEPVAVAALDDFLARVAGTSAARETGS